MRSISSNVTFKTCVSLLIFCFDNLSIGVSGVLTSLTIIVLLSISHFMSVFVLCIDDENLYSILSDVSLHLTYFLADLNISTVEFSIF